jgi:hypothetical protein
MKQENHNRVTIRDAIKFVKFKDVKRAIKYFYPEDKNNYKPVFSKLQKMTYEKPVRTNEEIVLHSINDFLVPEEPEYCYSIATNQYSLSFRRWSELINLPISQNTLSHFTYPDILAHFLWEITFNGFEEKEIAKEKKVLFSTLKNIK